MLHPSAHSHLAEAVRTAASRFAKTQDTRGLAVGARIPASTDEPNTALPALIPVKDD